MQGGGPASLHLVQSLSDSDDDNDSAWEGCLGDRYNPPGKYPPLSCEKVEVGFINWSSLGLSAILLLKPKCK